MRGYQSINRTHGLLMDGGVPDGYDNVLWKSDPYAGSSSLVGPLLALIDVGWAQFQNRAGTDVKVGIGARVARSQWKAFLMNAAGNLQDETNDAQDSGGNDFDLEVAGGNDSGFMVASPDRFNCIDVLVDGAGNGGTPVRKVQYSGPSGWKDYSNPLVAPPTTGNWIAGETLIWIGNPVDFTPMTEALHGTGVPVGWYGIRVVSTTAPTNTPGTAKSMSIAQVRQIKGVDDSGSSQVGSTFAWAPAGAKDLEFTCKADALVGVVTTAHDGNEWDVLVTTRG